MANRSFLTGCASREAAARHERGEIRASTEVLYSANYRIPLFWLVAFTPDDRLVIRKPKGAPYTVLCAPAAEAVARLGRRREAVLGVVGQRFAELYDAWIACVEARFPEMILLRTQEIFGLTSFEDTSARLDALLHALAPADGGAPITDTHALAGFQSLIEIHEFQEGQDRARRAEEHYALLAGLGDAGWPPPPSPAAIAVDPWGEDRLASALHERALAIVKEDPDRATELWEKARDHYGRALTAKPDMHQAEYRWGITLIAEAESWDDDDPKHAEALRDEAEKHYASALVLEPDMHEAEIELGRLMAFRASTVVDEDPARAVSLWEQAEPHYRRALDIEPDQHDAEYAVGSMLLHRAEVVIGDDPARAVKLLEQAAPHLARAVALQPDTRSTLCTLLAVEIARFRALRLAGHDAEAHAAGEHALELARQDEALTGRSYNVACALAVIGRLDEALDVLERMQQSGDVGAKADELRADPDLAALTGHPRFDALLAALRAPTA